MVAGANERRQSRIGGPKNVIGVDFHGHWIRDLSRRGRFERGARREQIILQLDEDGDGVYSIQQKGEHESLAYTEQIWLKREIRLPVYQSNLFLPPILNIRCVKLKEDVSTHTKHGLTSLLHETPDMCIQHFNKRS